MSLAFSQCYDTTFAIYMVLGPADVPPEEELADHQLVDQVGLLPLGQQKWDKLPANAEVQMTRSSSVRGAVFRGTCGYPLSKEDKNCSHLHMHVCTDCTAALYANQTFQQVATKPVASCTVDLRTTQTYWQLCSGLPRNQACSSHLVEFCKYTEVPSDAWVTSTEPEELSILREPEELSILREVARIGVNNIESSKSRS